MKFLITLLLLGSSDAHWWQGSDACGIVTITTVVRNEITYTEASTNIVFVTARAVKPREAVIVTVTGDAITLTTTLNAITSTATETIPPYATSACPDHSAYVEACRSHLNVVVNTITVTAPTSYVTEYATVNLPGVSLGGPSRDQITALNPNRVETITVTSTVIGEPNSGSSSKSSVVVELTSANVTFSSLSSSSLASEILLVQSSQTLPSLSSTLSFNSSSTTLSSTSTSLNVLSATFSNSLASSTESSPFSSLISKSETLTISPSNSSISSFNAFYTTILSTETRSLVTSSNSASGTMLTLLTPTSSHLPYTSSTITSQPPSNFSSTSTSIPTSSSSSRPRSPVSPLVATCNATAACRQNQHCSSDNTCLCQPSLSGTGYCMADTPCSALSSCTIDSDCGSGSACMRTCCSENKCLSLLGLCKNPNTATVIFKRDEEGNNRHRMPGDVGEEGEEWTNRGPWAKRLGRM
ncbi:f278ce81-25c4-4b75-8d26-52b20f117ce2 [Sclerotinia trifoliorum]|uniref:F278ce81-25c4-4b75-8d26-52b20f117ce2 n=1 Tax=Sclerotinia trifoliorum TaxID=28548 RepID=A0A8H2ZSW2_9HELO|nr:f278ce81-25c4-4b75-8d26-52b20f117ce2 [Sclerotinia trifoliorum]